MRMPPRAPGQALVALLVAAACSSPSPTGGSPPTSAAATVSSQPTAAPAPVLDDNFGLLVGNGVRRESDPMPVFGLDVGTGVAVVSPDGRRVGYLASSELRVIDVSAGAQPRTLLAIPNDEYANNLAWSSDSTGLVVGASGGGGGPAGAPPGYTALRVVDVAGGQTREIGRITNASVVPLAWDRQTHLVAAYEPLCCGTANYDLVGEDGSVQRTPPGSTLFFFRARDRKSVV